MAKRDGTTSLPQFSKMQLGQLFGLNRNTVTSRLREAVPDGRTPQNHATYSLPTVAHLLIDLQAAIKIDPNDDPEEIFRGRPDVEKDYWDAKLKEQQFRARDGQLLSDVEVLDMFARVFKPLAGKVRAISDALERRAQLSPKQVQAANEVCDDVLRELYNEVRKVAGAEDLDAEPAAELSTESATQGMEAPA